jgi:hypothetical protein
MKRRKFILGTGVFAAGSAGAIQTGAFTSVSARRGVSVAVAGDDSALLAIDGCEGPNGNYVTGAGTGTATLNISPSNDDVGDGVNPDAETVIHNVLELTQFYLNSDRDTEIVGEDNAKCLGVGESLCIGLYIDTTGLESGAELFNSGSSDHEMVVNADADASCAPPVSGGALERTWADDYDADFTFNGFAKNGGNSTVVSGRDDPNNAVGSVDTSKYPTGSYRDFFSLGFGDGTTDSGQIVLTFNETLVRNQNEKDLVVYESTNGDRKAYPIERADVYVAGPTTNGWVFAGQATSRGTDGTSNSGINGFDFPAGVNQVERVKIVEASDPGNFSSGSSTDGFDVDGVGGWRVVP